MTKARKYGPREQWCPDCIKTRKLIFVFGFIVIASIFLPFMLVPPEIAVDFVIVSVSISVILLFAISFLWIYKLYKLNKKYAPDG